MSYSLGKLASLFLLYSMFRNVEQFTCVRMIFLLEYQRRSGSSFAVIAKICLSAYSGAVGTGLCTELSGGGIFMYSSAWFVEWGNVFFLSSFLVFPQPECLAQLGKVDLCHIGSRMSDVGET